jgi:archaemetzincin
MEKKYITLVSFGYFERNYLEEIIRDLETEFATPVKIRNGFLNLSDFFDPSRKQYNANTLLKEIEKIYASESYKTLGIFNVDLFIPILTYIFGQAFLNGNCGIASVYRLTNERYGIKQDEKVFFERIKKEIIHELGHMFGLYHCTNSWCVMRSSTYVEDIDQKGSKLCDKCKELIELH